MNDATQKQVAQEVERVTTQAALDLTRIFSDRLEDAVISERSGCVQVIQDEMNRLEQQRPFDEELWGKLRDIRDRMNKRVESA